MKKTGISLIILVSLSILAGWSLTKPGFYGASDEMHLGWIQQMEKAVTEGKIPPRYVPDLSYGFGYPLFNFIFPLPYYLALVFRSVGFSLVDSFKLVMGVSLVASGISMYWLLRKLGSSFLAVAGGVVYMFSPYRATDVYVRGAIGESLAFIFLPIITAAVIMVAKNVSQRKWMAVGGLAVGGLVLSHNIVAYMFLPMAVILSLGITNKRQMVKQGVMFGWGLLISLYFWAPALIDSRMMKYDTIYNYWDHFPSLAQLVTPYWGYGGSVAGNYDTMSFFSGEVNLLILGIATLILMKTKNLIGWWALVMVGVSVIMTNYRSELIWKTLPMLDYFQFPWRFLTIITFGSSMLVMTLENLRYKNMLAGLIIGLAVITNYSRFKPQDFFPNRTDSYFLNRYIPLPFPSKEYENIGEEYLRLPKATTERPLKLYPRFYSKYGEPESVEIINSYDARAVTDFTSETEVSYNKYKFAGWKVMVDGQETESWAGKPYGQITFKVGAGIRNIEVKYKETSRNILMDIVSLLAILSGLGLVIKKEKKAN